MQMGLVAQAVLNGLSLSMVYMLVALGLTLIFSIMRIINFAHGEFYMMGGFLAYYLYGVSHLNFFVTLCLAALVVGVTGSLLERIVFAPLRGKMLSAFIVSLGLLWVMQGVAVLMFGVTDKSVPSPFSGVARIGGLLISYDRLVAIACSAMLLVFLYLLLSYSRYGLALRAVAQEPEAAVLQGINIQFISALAFGIGCGLAGVAGVLLAPVFFVNAFMGTLPVVKAFIIIILGGMGSLPGTVLGAMLLGLVEGITPLFLPIASVDLMGFALVIVLLVLRPRGLLGRA